MRLASETFRNNERIPGRCAFGVPDPATHMKLGQNRNPQLSWSEVPAEAKSLVLFCIDTEVPSSLENFNKEGSTIAASLPRVEFCHWVMVDIPARGAAIAEGACSDGITKGGKKNPPGPAGSRQGINDYTPFMASDPEMKGDYYGYEGPCPPWNDERLHHYHFMVYATDLAQCPVEGRFTGQDVQKTLRGHILAEARLTGTYTLNPEVR